MELKGFLKGFQTRSLCFPASASLSASREARVRLLNCSSPPPPALVLLGESGNGSCQGHQSCCPIMPVASVLRGSHCGNLTSTFPAECLAGLHALTWLIGHGVPSGCCCGSLPQTATTAKTHAIRRKNTSLTSPNAPPPVHGKHETFWASLDSF